MKQKGGVCFIMNNEQRSSFVKEQITKTLIQMLGTQKLEDISVRDLTDQAGVGRVSFYRNFADKEDILRQESDRLLRQWGQDYESDITSTLDTLFPSLFGFLRHNRQFYTTLYRAGLSGILMDTIVKTINPTKEENTAAAYAKAFMAYGIFGWINDILTVDSTNVDTSDRTFEWDIGDA